jgi:hypothetical protein
LVEAGTRIGMTGVVSKRFAVDGMSVDDPREAVLQVVAANKGRYDTLVVLAYLPEEELTPFASSLPEADIVVGGPTGQSIAPRQIGPTLLASATNKGKFLVQLEAAPEALRRWSGGVIELGTAFADDAKQQANLIAYLERLTRQDFTAGESGFAPALPAGLPAGYRIAGSASCQSCHQADCNQWAQSKHAHAWDSLAARGFHVDSYCQQCHTTGYGLPGGFESAARSAAFRGVGCESCHGPSEAHVRDPKQRTPFAARDQCVRCHDHENSPTFDYALYWERIRHGTKAGGGAPRR